MKWLYCLIAMVVASSGALGQNRSGTPGGPGAPTPGNPRAPIISGVTQIEGTCTSGQSLVKSANGTVGCSGGGGGGGGSTSSGYHACTAYTGPPYSIDPVNICEFDACFITQTCSAVQGRTAIQAAIDYAYNNGTRGIYCPANTYGTDVPIFVDPPGNLRGTIGMSYDIGHGSKTLVAFNPATTYAQYDLVSYLGVPWQSTTNGNVGVTPALTGDLTSQQANWTPVTMTPSIVSWNPSFIGSPGLSGDLYTCWIRPTYATAPVIWMGTNNGQTLHNVKITPNTSFPGFTSRAGLLPPGGIGVCIAGGPGGANRTDIANMGIYVIGTLIRTGCNSDGLGAENNFTNISGDFCTNGIVIGASQNDINRAYNPSFSCNNNFVATAGPGMTIIGGNVSNTEAWADRVTISGISALTSSRNSNNIYKYLFTATLPSPPVGMTECSINLQNPDCKEKSWTIVTKHFGPVPLLITAFNSMTNVASFETTIDWGGQFFQTSDALTYTDLQAEVQAPVLGIVYAAQWVTTFTGNNFNIQSVHLEQDGDACTTFLNDTSSFNAGKGNTLNDIRANYIIPLQNFGKAGEGMSPSYPCQHATPFLVVGSADIALTNSNLGGYWPFIINFASPSSRLLVTAFNQSIINPRLWVQPQTFLQNNPISGGSQAQYSQGFGGGTWDYSPFEPVLLAGTGGPGGANTYGGVATPFLGFRPQPYSQPRLLATDYNLLSTPTVTRGAAALLPLASPGVVQWGGTHGLAAGSPVYFSGAGTIPTGAASCVATSPCYVSTAGLTGTAFQVSLNLNNALAGTNSVNFTGASVGSQTATALASTYFSNYIPVSGQTIYSVLDWNAQTAKLAQSGHYWFSYGQPLNHNTHPTISWEFKGQSPFINVDHQTLNLVYPGLNIILDNGSPVQYEITGIEPNFELVGHVNASTTFQNGGPAVLVNDTTNFAQGMSVQFTAGSLPSGLALNTEYFVSDPIVANTSFQLMDINGNAITWTGTGGTATSDVYYPGFITVINTNSSDCSGHCGTAGTSTTIYQGSSIGQSPFSWKTVGFM